MIVQTAVWYSLGEFTPKFAYYYDGMLFDAIIFGFVIVNFILDAKALEEKVKAILIKKSTDTFVDSNNVYNK